MARKSVGLPESEFWKRLRGALKNRGYPDSQNGIATKLDMSQGTVQAWVRGESLPTMANAVILAGKARVCVEWLLTGEGPKTPAPDDPRLAELTELWNQLDVEKQAELLRFAQFASSQQSNAQGQKSSLLNYDENRSVQDRPTRLRTRR